MGANLDLVRSIYADWEQGDWSTSEWADPQIEFVVADGPDRRTRTGVDAMATVWREFLTAWAGYAVMADDYRELDPTHVLVLLHARGSGKASGVQIQRGSERGANVFHIEAGRVRRLAIYFDHAHALADLGLLE